jgi:hypothetical protein
VQEVAGCRCQGDVAIVVLDTRSTVRATVESLQPRGRNPRVPIGQEAG